MATYLAERISPSTYSEQFFRELSEFNADMALVGDEDEIERREKASQSLLAYTQYTFPQYKVDAFHRHLAGVLTGVTLDAQEGKSRHVMLFAPPQHGKLCAHDTPVLTTNGWKTHGTLRPGDFVFNERGQPVRVIALSAEMPGDREIEFTDGSVVRCHANHEWAVYDRSENSKYRNKRFVYETKEMESVGLWYGHRGQRGGRGKFQVDAPPRISGERRDLPVDPYTLGVWLGDGSTSKNCITYHPDDSNMVGRIESAGIRQTTRSVHKKTGIITGYFEELYAPLKEMGLLGNKHIPESYFTASVDQRLRLLAGLIDSDGCVYHENGRVTFSNTDEIVIRDVVRLVSTLGWRTTEHWANPQTSTSGIVGKKPVCQITFNPDLDIPTALPRKKTEHLAPATRRRSIKEIRTVQPSMGRCIQVEGGIYLVGDKLIPTHNSELVSTRLPSFWLGHNPDLPVALVSYGASLAYRNSRYARAVMDSPFYPEIFPGMNMDKDNWRVEDWHLKDHKGYTMAVGVGGPITGHGFGLGLIDDPIENWAAAQSETLRESVWQWWLGTFRTRLWEGASVIFMMTRWHEDDLAGRILEHEGRVEEGGKWEVLSYPALCEDPEIDPLGRSYHEPLAPSRYSREWLEDFRQTSVEQVWQAEYQQNPIPPSGDFFKIGRIEAVPTVPAEICQVIRGVPINIGHGARYWDLAGTDKKLAKRDPDATSGTLISDHEGHFYVLDNVNVKWGPDEVENLIKQTANLDGRNVRIRIEQEPGQSGKAQKEHYIKLLAGFDIDGIPSSGDKRVRAAAFAAQVNAGNVKILKGPWNKNWLAELANFPHGRHDDDVDSASGAFNSLDLEGKKWRSTKFVSV